MTNCNWSEDDDWNENDYDGGDYDGNGYDSVLRAAWEWGFNGKDDDRDDDEDYSEYEKPAQSVRLPKITLHLAARENAADAIAALLKYGADIETQDASGHRPIDLATDENVKALIKKTTKPSPRWWNLWRT